MTIRYIQIQTNGNKYVQFRYIGTAVTGSPNPFLNTANWQGLDDEPTAGSDNLVKSGGVYVEISQLGQKVNEYVYTDNERFNRNIKDIFIDTSGYTDTKDLSGLKIRVFGYSFQLNRVWMRLHNSKSQTIVDFTFDHTKFEHNLIKSGIKLYLFGDISDYVSNTPHEDYDIQFVGNKVFNRQIIGNEQIEDNLISENKIEDGAVSNRKLKSKTLVAGEDVTAVGVVASGFVPYYGGIVESSSWINITYNVAPGESYRISSFSGQDARLWIVYDSANNRIGYSSDGSLPSKKKTETITIPTNGAILIVNGQANKEYSVLKYVEKIDGQEVYLDGKSLSAFIDDKIISSHELGNILFGKTLVCAGDSITYGEDIPADGIDAIPAITMFQQGATGNITQVTQNAKKSYGYQIAKRNKMIFYNAGVSGSTMQGLANKYGFSLADGRYTKLPEHIDYLTIFFGWNDTAYGTLGTINDETNESYYGGYNVVLPFLLNKYPYAKTALIVPFGTDVEHRQAIRELSNKWGVACFDMYQGGTPLYYGKEPSVGVDASIVTENRAKFQANGAHPNTQGHFQISCMLEQFLRGI